MATKLKGLSVTSVDLVDQGANPDAHICLFKHGEQNPDADANEGLIRKFLAWLNKGNGGEAGGEMQTVEKEAQTFSENLNREQMRAVMSQMFDCCYALSDSFSSIISDNTLGADAKQSMILTSLDEFSGIIRGAAEQWAAGKKMQDSAAVQKSAEQQEAFEELFSKYAKSGNESDEPAEPQDKGEKTKEVEEEDTMKIDKSKMTPEERATLAEFEKKYGVADDPTSGAASGAEPPATTGGVEKAAQPAPASAQPTTPAELHPDVAKALADYQELMKRQNEEVEGLKKSLEIERLTAVAKKYEVLGKNASELAAKLYDLKKAGGTVYDDYVALLDENVTALEKSGLFGEIGKNRSGSVGTEQSIGVKAAELAKAVNGMSTPDAIIKAWEENPELAAQYEAEYMNRR